MKYLKLKVFQPQLDKLSHLFFNGLINLVKVHNDYLSASPIIGSKEPIIATMSENIEPLHIGANA